jgi:hypothetical protein
MAEALANPDAVERFSYCGVDVDVASATVVCHYALDDIGFTETVTIHPLAGLDAADDARFDPDAVDTAAVVAAARLVYLLAGVSYYKAAAPGLIVVDTALTDDERQLLEAFYRDGLGEYAVRNGLDLSGVTVVADHRPTPPAGPRGEPPTRPLVPFGGGIDSIVTVEGIRPGVDDAALFVMSRAGDRFTAIEQPAAVTGWPVVRAERTLDPKVLRSAQLGYRNGHVPVTGVLSAVALLAAAFTGRDAVVMSNEWSASSPNFVHHGHEVNHQWSKSLAFEGLLRAVLAHTPELAVDYFSWLRASSELWVAQRFAALTPYHHAFRSCNRSFRLDRDRRLDRWCGTCDKCCFIDLILAPYLGAAELAAVFDGNEPLDNPALGDTFRSLAGLSADPKPFECVGDVDECRVAVLLAAARPDRAGTTLLADLAAETAAVVPGDVNDHARRLLGPLGPHHIPGQLAAHTP